MRISALVLILFCCVTGVYGYQITEVYPDTYLNGDADEYLIITGQGSLNMLTVTDGEGTITFPSGSVSSGTITIARDGEAFHSVTERYPDYELIGKNPTVPNLEARGHFQLGNQKDDLTLVLDGKVIQNITWPGSFKPRKGQIHYINSHGVWDERVLISGASRFESEVFSNISGTVFVSPDCGRTVFEQVVTSANQTILMNIYEFTDPGIAALLCQAADRGVKVTVLIEGGPVGGISPDEKSVISMLVKNGIQVAVMKGVGEDHAPYRYDHAKYLIIDGKYLLLTTENFTPHSLPSPGLSGNRGWGVMVTSSELAAYFSKVYESDLNGPGVVSIPGNSSDILPYAASSYHTVFQPVQFRNATVTPVLAPDTCNLIIPFIKSASRRLLIEEAYIKHWSGGKKNPYLDAVIQTARRGVNVRILLDSYPYNIEDEGDNDDIVAEINLIADQENLPLEARLIDLNNLGLLKLHAKGVIADDAVFISSINWNENSPVFNREAGLIISDKTAAGYFASVFEQDWKGEMRVSSGNKGPDQVKIITVTGVILLLIVVYWWRHRK